MDDPGPTRRQLRAEEVRRRALSPVRILLMILALPVTTAMIAAGAYLRISDYDRDEAVIHLIALAGCDAALSVAQGPFYEGQAGYHARNDQDRDGVACGTSAPAPLSQSADTTASKPTIRSVGSAKFVRP